MNKIDGVTILGLEIKLYGEIQEDNQIDGGFTTIDVKLEKVEEIFSDCKYDLIATDFMNLNGEFYISSDLNVETITLFVKFDGGLTQAIDIKIEE
jgi:outer membrane receptor for monomeric catechols